MAENNNHISDLQCAAIAQEYFDAYRSKQIQSGFVKFVCTDGTHTMFVNPSYEPDPADENLRIFRCEVRRGADGRCNTAGTAVELVWPRSEEADEKLWQAFENFCATPPYYKKNGIVYHNGKQQTPVDNAWLKGIIREVLDERSES